MPLFGRKKEQDSQSELGAPGMGAYPGNNPYEEVSSMRQQGYSNDQIIQGLQGKGYKSDEIFDAMGQADLNRPGGPLPMQQDMPGQGMPMPPPNGMSMPPPNGMPMPPPQMPMPSPQWQDNSISAPERERIEEVAEAIIDEKWKEVMGDISKVIEWKRVVDSRLDRIEQQINDLKANFDALHTGVLGRISEYDKNLTNVGVEIKAMEKVFQKILPTFTENVNRLSRISKK